jgi:hypothetical protein
MGMSTGVIRLLDQVHLDIPAASEDPSWTIPHSRRPCPGVPTSVLEMSRHVANCCPQALNRCVELELPE